MTIVATGNFILIVEILYDFSMTRAARAIKIARDNRKQKSFLVNRPLIGRYNFRL